MSRGLLGDVLVDTMCTVETLIPAPPMLTTSVFVSAPIYIEGCGDFEFCK
jgi:hypothetical protein